MLRAQNELNFYFKNFTEFISLHQLKKMNISVN